jgi:integrase/recombinase XerD
MKRIIMKTLFYISPKKTNKKGFAPIYCRITVNGKRCEISTGFFIKPNQWQNESLIETNNDNILQNMALTKIKYDINSIYCELILKNKSVSADIVKDLYIGNSKNNHSFIELINEYIEHKFKTFKEYNTVKGYRSRKTLIVGYLTTIQRTNMMPEDFNIKQLEMYIDYLLKEKKLQRSYVNRQVTFLKACFNYGIRMDYIKANPIATIELHYDKAKPIIALTKEELLKLTTHKFACDRLQHVADCYIFQSFTGFAYVDLFDFDYEQHIKILNGKKWIIKSRVKSHIEATVPLFNDAKRILTKYNYKLPVISNQKYNDYLKEITKALKISKELTTHTARKTFAMVKLNDGFSIESVAKMMGHNSIKVTQSTYAQVNTGRIEAEQLRLGIK